MQKLGLENVYYVHLFLSDISLFQSVNEEYCKFFGKSPPSRTCVALPFTSVQEQKVTVKAHFNISAAYIARKVLHVRSISEWAPSCIGPYSQANVIGDSLIFLAGQIPLIPGAMKVQECAVTDLDNTDLCVLTWNRAVWWPICCIQVAACVRHISNLLESLDSSTSQLVSFIIYVNVGPDSPMHEATSLGKIFEDISNLATQLLAKCRAKKSRDGVGCDEEVVEEEEEKNDDEEEEDDDEVHLPPISVIGVHGLPRNCLIEVESAALTASAATGRVKCIRKNKVHKLEFVSLKDTNVNQSQCRPVPIESSWPFWSTDIFQKVSHLPLPCELESKKVLQMEGNVHHMTSYCKFYPKVFSFGSCSLSFDVKNGWHCVAYVIASCLQDYLVESETDIESIKRVLIVCSYGPDSSLLMSSLEYYFQILIGIKQCPIILLPVGKNNDVIITDFSVSIIWEAFNLDKMFTEKWLNKLS